MDWKVLWVSALLCVHVLVVKGQTTEAYTGQPTMAGAQSYPNRPVHKPTINAHIKVPAEVMQYLFEHVNLLTEADVREEYRKILVFLNPAFMRNQGVGGVPARSKNKYRNKKLVKKVGGRNKLKEHPAGRTKSRVTHLARVKPHNGSPYRAKPIFHGRSKPHKFAHQRQRRDADSFVYEDNTNFGTPLKLISLVDMIKEVAEPFKLA